MSEVDLRTRIAGVIYNDNAFGWTEYQCGEAADAVIRELQLTILGDGIVVGVIHV